MRKTVPKFSSKWFRRKAMTVLGIKSNKGVKNKHLFAMLSEHYKVSLPPCKVDCHAMFKAIMKDVKVQKQAIETVN